MSSFDSISPTKTERQRLNLLRKPLYAPEGAISSPVTPAPLLPTLYEYATQSRPRIRASILRGHTSDVKVLDEGSVAPMVSLRQPKNELTQRRLRKDTELAIRAQKSDMPLFDPTLMNMTMKYNSWSDTGFSKKLVNVLKKATEENKQLCAGRKKLVDRGLARRLKRARDDEDNADVENRDVPGLTKCLSSTKYVPLGKRQAISWNSATFKRFGTICKSPSRLIDLRSGLPKARNESAPQISSSVKRILSEREAARKKAMMPSYLSIDGRAKKQRRISAPDTDTDSNSECSEGLPSQSTQSSAGCFLSSGSLGTENK
eukprot:IDg13375t1